MAQKLPPTYRGSPIHTCTPIYDDVTPRDIAMPNTPSTVPDTPPNLPPPRRSKVHCDSEIPPELPPPYRGSPIPTCMPVYDDVIPKESQPNRDSAVPNAPMYHPDTPPKLPPPRGSKVHCDSESPAELPPTCRHCAVLSCTPLYDDVFPKEATNVLNGNTQRLHNPDSPPHLPFQRDREATSSDTETPLELPPPYRDSAVRMTVYDDANLKQSSAKKKNTPNALTQGFSSAFLNNCDSPPHLPRHC